ncbi:MAG: mechanosensitive ion channel family protein [Cyclobacteriaceae bacterium]
MKSKFWSFINKIEHDIRNRILFALKVLLIVFLIYVENTQPDWIERLQIPIHYINALIFYVSGNVIITIIRFTVVYFYLKSRREHISRPDNFMLGMISIASILNFVIFIFALFIFFRIDYREVFTSLSIIAAAIAILSKDYISNLINGMIIMFTDHFSLGDFVKIDEHRGKIVDITYINVQLLNEEDDLVYIPNNLILAKDVVNYTKRAVNKVNIEFELKYNFIENVGEMETYLIEVIQPFMEYIEDDSCLLRTLSIKNDSLMLSFQYIIKENNKEIENRIRRKVLRSIVKYIRAREENNASA